MLRTIKVGSSLLIQGLVIGTTDDGKLLIRVGDKTFAGTPVPRLRAA
jgi:hypothetical protein